ncbi:Transcription factor SOX-10 [Kappamyces sp. JEL0829]|nr:Transcription factor SOX-10 [Kappamyces sp. JEL0829]
MKSPSAPGLEALIHPEQPSRPSVSKKPTPKPHKKPMNCFFRYKQAVRQRIIDEHGVSKNADISRIASALWRQEDPAVRKKFELEAEKAFIEHKILYPDFVWPSKSEKYRKTKTKSPPPTSIPSPRTTPELSLGTASTAEHYAALHPSRHHVPVQQRFAPPLGADASLVPGYHPPQPDLYYNQRQPLYYQPASLYSSQPSTLEYYFASAERPPARKPVDLSDLL